MFCFAQHILLDRCLLFAQQHKEKWPNTVVVEDGITLHQHSLQQDLHSTFEIEKVLWPGNSPDMNMIEQVWGDLKKEIKMGGPLHSKEEAIEQCERIRNSF